MLKKVTDNLTSLLTVLKSFFAGPPGPTPGSIYDFMANVGDTNHFVPDSDQLSLDSEQQLDRQVEWLKKYPKYNVLVEGHCDPDEGTREYCLGLGQRRAQNTKQYLSKFIDPSRVEIISYGKERPIVITTSDYRNRRTVTIVR